MGFLDWLKAKFASTSAESDVRVVVDDVVVRCEYPDGLVESVAWNDLQRVSVITTDHGPFVEDVFFALDGSDGGCLVPQGAPEFDVIFERVGEFPGFDDEAFVKAMCCADNNEFLCWERKD